jgi:hypothetical protein
VAHRSFKVAVVHPFDDHHRNTEARDLKATNDTMLVWCGHGGNGIHWHRLVSLSQAKLPGEIPGLPGLIKVRFQEDRQAVTQSQSANHRQCTLCQLQRSSDWN